MVLTLESLDARACYFIQTNEPRELSLSLDKLDAFLTDTSLKIPHPVTHQQLTAEAQTIALTC